jgi:hypothetical protein
LNALSACSQVLDVDLTAQLECAVAKDYGMAQPFYRRHHRRYADHATSVTDRVTEATSGGVKEEPIGRRDPPGFSLAVRAERRASLCKDPPQRIAIADRK